MDTHTQKHILVRLPKLATIAFVFWGLSSSAPLDAAPVWLRQEIPPHIAPQEGDIGVRVLSSRDATLYRVAFTAQERADWNVADQALAKITDKRLTGHVLADRYARRGMTLNEAKEWFASYADLSEAEDLYVEARKLRGFTSASIPRPANASEWQGGSASLSPAGGFQSSNDNNAECGPKAALAKAEIYAALKRDTPEKANELLTRAINQNVIPANAAGDVAGRIALSFFHKRDLDAARKVAHIAAKTGAPLGLWVEGLSAWKLKDFGQSARSFSKLAKQEDLLPWNQATASYWAYRAYSRLGDKTEAYRWLAQAANIPHSFYGAMAANLMGRQGERSWKMPELESKSIELLASAPAGWQALALTQVGRADLAEGELRRLLSTSGKMQTAALALAEKARMPSLVLALSGVTTSKNGQPFDAALYPLPPWQPSGGFTVDRALIYAIMRHESHFNPDAVSTRGACGLMQIMPRTARLIEKIKHGGRSSECVSGALLDPTTNVNMGQKYVRTLSETPMIGNNLLFLLAAYNSGPGNLSRWIDGHDSTDPLLFIESLPVRETRYYVQQVLLYYWMYKARLSQPETAIAQLSHGEWPKLAARDADSTEVGAREIVANVDMPGMNETR